MKKFYYYSKFKIHPVELKNYRLKFALLVAAIFCIATLVLFSGYLVYTNYINPPKDLAALRNENLLLKSRLKNIAGQYKNLETELDSIIVRNNTLRVAANLPAMSNDEQKLATGGNAFGSLLDLIAGKEVDLKQTIAAVDQVVKKFEFEKGNLTNIQAALATNQELYKAIPAIKPCTGELAAHGFGMRMHPILHIMRMHEGVDIITNVGTMVYAPAEGTVDFVGYKNGLGLCVELDHGFGYRTIYGHLSATTVKEGQHIKRSQNIAKTGNTGLSSGPHLHYEVLHDGINLDPVQFFFNDNYVFNSTPNSKE
ncbi:MAG: peptidoglycan DD-metalloendopeptidase family protein [Ignavibacteria bacterium]|nr:peptidoglycan DD-metalloendopeptidase family protein [Ignavibacteria bacterium]